MVSSAAERPAQVADHDDGSIADHDDQPLTPLKVCVSVPADVDREGAVFQVFKLALPHLFLLLISIGYVYIGALTFMRLEEPHWRQQRARQLQTLQEQKERFAGKLYDLGRSGRQLDGVEGSEEFNKYASEVYRIHQIGLVTREDLRTQFGSNATAVDDAAGWTLGVSIFFVISTLTTIGIYSVIVVRFVI